MLLALGGFAVGSHAIVVAGISFDRVAGDSLDLLLLSTPPIASVTVRGSSMRIDGGRVGVPRIDITASGDILLVDGASRSRLTIAAPGELRIGSGNRARAVRGAIRIEARNDRLSIVARVGLEDYLAGALEAESGARDPRAYRVALSILQRNYLVTHQRRHAPLADLCDNTHCQLYAGISVGAPAHAIVRDALALELIADGALPCYYSSNCGGGTLRPADVWGRSEPGYSAVRCDDCRNDRWRRWTRTVPATAAARAALAGAPTAPFIDDDFKIRVGRALGFNTLPSNTVDRLERRGAHYHISGRGFGHRVGLCQAGARELARRGRNAREILERYFPTATVRPARASETN